MDQSSPSFQQQQKQHQGLPSPANIGRNNSSSSSGSSNNSDSPSSSDERTRLHELRRQIHIQSEQKRRAQIKDGFEELRNHLPSCLNKKMSKVALLHRTVQHIQHLKSTQMSILAELERLLEENQKLRRFQQEYLNQQGSVVRPADIMQTYLYPDPSIHTL
ncbi:hypothetical protein VTP01DRAFT_600 [Rhizomucor pusillus]|uniref:uncharacterized protein n=1 Tax=Rhizomucor pusillus TaxID=4840 RepID=UPI0037422153